MSHTLNDIYISRGDKTIIRTLTKDGMIRRCTLCPKCGYRRLGRSDTLSPTTRCTNRSCRARFASWQEHPLLRFHGNALPWSDQATMLTMILQDVPNHLMHTLYGFKHSIIEEWKGRFREHIAKYVESKQADITFALPDTWVDVEADEVTLGKRAASPLGRRVEWIQFLGLMRRGSPETLVLVQLPPRKTGLRAPGPGPLRQQDWLPIANQFLKNQHAVLHTDSARAYLLPIAGVRHTRVIHQKKKVGDKWLLPKYTQREDIELPNGDIIHVIAGTQFVDGLWKRSWLHKNYQILVTMSFNQKGSYLPLGFRM